MKVTIYQIVPELDNDHMMFRDFRNLCIACGGELPAECYEAVYTGEVNAVTLEDVYRIFNIEHPKGFRGHSLSPSDVVEIYNFAEESSFYYCNPVGFLKIPFDKKNAFSEIQNHDYEQCEIIRCGNFSIVFLGAQGMQSAHCSKVVLTRCKYSKSQLGYRLRYFPWGEDGYQDKEFLSRPKVLYVESGFKSIPVSAFYEQAAEMQNGWHGRLSDDCLKLAEKWCRENGYRCSYLL